MLRCFVMTLAMVFLLSGCSSTGRFATPYASGYHADDPIQCVPYTREVSSVNIRGDAHTWWGQAQGRYERGNAPRPGAVLVLKNTSRMRHGHVATVRRVISPRHIDVAHSNWGNDRKTRSVVYELMRVEDISPMNNWTSVRFWNMKESVFGSPYPAFGFIYP